jgi:predicted aspartyl protease
VKHAYDTEHHPPAPALSVTIRNPSDEQKQMTVVALVDTGADITILPEACIDLIGGKPGADCEVYTVEGYLGIRRTYFLHLEVAGVTRLKQVLEVGGQVILGRNLLNELKIELDGPGQTVTVWPLGEPGTESG